MDSSLTPASFVLGILALLVTLYIGASQLKIQKSIRMEKRNRRKHGALSFNIALSDLILDVEYYVVYPNAPITDTDRKKFEEYINKIKDTLLFYNQDLPLDVIRKYETTINQFESWLENPTPPTIPESDITATITNTSNYYSISYINQQLEELEKTLEEIYQ